MWSSIEETINSVQNLFVRQMLTTSKLRKNILNWYKFHYSMNYQDPLFQKVVSIRSCGMKNYTLFHESLLTMYKNYNIDNQMLCPGVDIVEISLTAGTQCINNA